jgi:agmatinase
MRRVKEQINPIKLIEIGTRSVSKEELEYAEKSDIQFITVGRIREDGVPKTLKNVEKLLVDCKKIYLTIDMDVLDPAFAPAVQNPEPDGLSMSVFLSLLEKVCALPIVAFDLVEVTPPYDRGITAIHAAKVIYEVLCHIEHAQN